jgi:hypothetical protein
MGIMRSAIQTVASRLSGVGVWVGDGMGLAVGDGTRVVVGRTVGVLVGGSAVVTCSKPVADWHDVKTNARLTSRIFVKGKRTGTSPNEDDQILSLPHQSLTRKNTSISVPFFEIAGASEVY